MVDRRHTFRPECRYPVPGDDLRLHFRPIRLWHEMGHRLAQLKYQSGFICFAIAPQLIRTTL